MLLSKILHLNFIVFVYVLCVTYSVKAKDLALVIDDSLSMWHDILEIQSSFDDILTSVIAEENTEIQNYLLVTFNDPDTVLRAKTSNKMEFINALKRLKVYNTNNQDCPEYTLSGIELALKESQPGSYVLAITDASAKDYLKFNDIKNLCEEKQSRVKIFALGNCLKADDPEFTVYKQIETACSSPNSHSNFLNNLKDKIAHKQ